MKVEDIPVYICVRDRVSDLRGMVAWLQDAGQRNIILLDNDSTYPPLLEYFQETTAQIVLLGQNYGHHALFLAGINPEPPFYYTDPDLEFLGPHNGLRHLCVLAERFPDRDKIGFGLTLEGVPRHMPQWDWETSLQSPAREIELGVLDSPLDTTFAIYNRPTISVNNALRTGEPNVMRHSSWYTYPQTLSEEDRYYLGHCEDPCSTWMSSQR